MKRVKRPLLGPCPIGEFVFSHEDAMRHKRLIMERFDRWGIDYVHLDAVLADGMVRDQSHVEPVVRYFADRRIDGLFIPHCNFGTEGAAAMIARQCGVPVLLCGPRDDPSFIPDIAIRHPENDNAVLLWHGDAPLALRHPDSPVKVDLPWILKGLPTGLVHFRPKDGPLTLGRFEGHGDDIRLGCGEGHTVPGPYTQEFYAWMEVDDWPTWERQLIFGPYIHHSSSVYGHCADVLEEASRYIPGLTFERFGVSGSAAAS